MQHKPAIHEVLLSKNMPLVRMLYFVILRENGKDCTKYIRCVYNDLQLNSFCSAGSKNFGWKLRAYYAHLRQKNIYN